MPAAPCDPAPLEGPTAPELPASCKWFARPGPPAARAVVDAPVFVLIDRGTGSAAEWFAAVLHDNRAATLVGEQTVGAGCGYTNGGIRLALSHTGIAIAAPDCARYRGDGSNEIDGVRPDVVLDWTLADRTGRWASYAEKALSEADRLFRAAP
jgi:C-terminal processing protease CtpA/Prc